MDEKIKKIRTPLSKRGKATDEQIFIVDDLIARVKESGVMPKQYVNLVYDVYLQNGYAPMDEKKLKKSITKVYTREASNWEVALAIHDTMRRLQAEQNQ